MNSRYLKYKIKVFGIGHKEKIILVWEQIQNFILRKQTHLCLRGHFLTLNQPSWEF